MYSQHLHKQDGGIMTVCVEVDKEDALVDQVLNIKVKQLQCKQPITVRAEVIEGGKVFAGSGWFVADDNGTVNLSTQASSGGTYKGVSPMGLFWSMRSSPSMPVGLRLIKNNGSSPLLTELTVFPGHLTFDETYITNTQPVCNKKLRRWYMAKGVQKIPIRSGRIRGTLFLPPGSGPFPGVIDMFGVVGSCVEFRAALLASRGFASLALPYYVYEDLPKDFENVEFEYFMEAVEWFSVQPCVDGSNLGVMGVSKGGEIALHLAYYNNKIKSVVSINGAPFFTHTPMLYKGVPTGITYFNVDGMIVTDEGMDLRNTMDCEIKDYLPLWNKDAHVLLISGLDDRCLQNKFLRNLWKCYPTSRKTLCELYEYAGAGHLIEPPYAPLARSTKKVMKGIGALTDTVYILWGGETVAHAHAQEDSWKRILQHFRTTLCTSTRTSEYDVSMSKL